MRETGVGEKQLQHLFQRLCRKGPTCHKILKHRIGNNGSSVFSGNVTRLILRQNQLLFWRLFDLCSRFSGFGPTTSFFRLAFNTRFVSFALESVDKGVNLHRDISLSRFLFLLFDVFLRFLSLHRVVGVWSIEF